MAWLLMLLAVTELRKAIGISIDEARLMRARHVCASEVALWCAEKKWVVDISCWTMGANHGD